MIIHAEASNNDLVPVDSVAHVFTYNGDGTLATDSVSYGNKTWVQTYTWTNGNLTGVSGWVLQ